MHVIIIEGKNSSTQNGAKFEYISVFLHLYRPTKASVLEGQGFFRVLKRCALHPQPPPLNYIRFDFESQVQRSKMRCACLAIRFVSYPWTWDETIQSPTTILWWCRWLHSHWTWWNQLAATCDSARATCRMYWFYQHCNQAKSDGSSRCCIHKHTAINHNTTIRYYSGEG